MHSDSSQNLKLRCRLELQTGTGERIAEYDVCEEIPLVLGEHATTETEQLVIGYLERRVLDGARALIRARMQIEAKPDPIYLARANADLGLEDGVDEAVASLTECLRARSR